MSLTQLRISHNALAALALVTAIIVASVAADIDGPSGLNQTRSTIDAGGGTSSGGAFLLNGSIGQSDAGSVMSGGPFTLAGGFWPGAGPVPVCLGDIAPIPTDGTIGVPDLLAIINSWGACPAPCPADLAPSGGDGTVGVPDLLAVINAWGPCP